MKNNSIIIMLMLAPFCSLAANNCTPNLTGQDMCTVANEIVNATNKYIPIKYDDNMNIVNAKAENTRVILTTQMNYNRIDLEKEYGNSEERIEESKTFSRRYAREKVCSNRSSKAFVNLGGVIQYEYFFNDGKLFDIVTVTSCK
ncbi:hypothetical protein [Serratia bockelmannii]|uniref:hypothetical protein n=1 Tax=Serratia bockelmannii TaxID=2703793 RepID=UPI00235EBDC1|nr:hypothetical protein [Serratia bockelmannii]